MSFSSQAAPDTLEVASPHKTARVPGFAAGARVLGKGGAGTVYAHPALPGQAIKIYADESRAQVHEAKVLAMLKTTPSTVRTPLGTVQIAWPSAAVFSAGRFAGFVMPQIDFSQAWTLQRVIQPSQRDRHRIPERLELRLYAADSDDCGRRLQMNATTDSSPKRPGIPIHPGRVFVGVVMGSGHHFGVKHERLGGPLSE